jgi:nitric oxide reductase subunit B
MDDRRSYTGLWVAFALVMSLSFAVLGGFGFRIAAMAPPIPDSVRTPDGQVVVTGDLIREGQNVWQSLGGQEIGSIWGHGAYVAPDWSADWLHRELVAVLDRWAVERGSARYLVLPPADQAVLRKQLRTVIRTNSYDASNGVLTIDPARAAAFESLARHYADVFGNGRSPRGNRTLQPANSPRSMSTRRPAKPECRVSNGTPSP